jgi:hypothetical protein
MDRERRAAIRGILVLGYYRGGNIARRVPSARMGGSGAAASGQPQLSLRDAVGAPDLNFVNHTGRNISRTPRVELFSLCTAAPFWLREATEEELEILA